MKQTQAELAKTEAVQRVVEARAVAEEARQQKIVEDRENLKQVQEERYSNKVLEWIQMPQQLQLERRRQMS